MAYFNLTLLRLHALYIYMIFRCRYLSKEILFQFFKFFCGCSHVLSLENANNSRRSFEGSTFVEDERSHSEQSTSEVL